MITIKLDFVRDDTRCTLADSGSRPAFAGRMSGSDATALMHERAAQHIANGRPVRLMLADRNVTLPWLGAWGLRNP
jgi:hypothetical protein